LEPAPTKRGHYSQAKTEAEKIVAQAVKERGLRAIILRPGRVFGPGSPLMTPDVARQAGNRLIILGDGDQALPLVYVEDVVDGIMLAFASDRFDGSIFHLVDSERVTQNDVVRAYVDARQQRFRITHVPRFIVYTLAYGVEVLGAILSRPVPLTTYRVKSAMAPMTFDCSAAEKTLGWRPQTGVRTGLVKTLAAG
jgi:nucleoside-diphosphate-sugar epimerase